MKVINEDMKYMSVKHLGEHGFMIVPYTVQVATNGMANCIRFHPRLWGGVVHENQKYIGLYNEDGVLLYIPITLWEKQKMPFTFRSEANSTNQFYYLQDKEQT